MDSLPNYLKGLIGPSILNADLSMLAEDSRRLLNAGADYLHLDVMDGHFVPNLTIGHPVIKCLRKNIPKVYFDAHMMVAKPEQWIEEMAGAGVNQYTFHIESVASSKDIRNIIRKIKEADMKVGIGIKPATDVNVLTDYIDDIDVVLIMTVEPGFGGQKFKSDMMEKIRWLRKTYPQLLHIEVDGGVNMETIKDCAQAGANMIVSGSALIDSKQPNKDIEQMRQLIDESIKQKKVNIQLTNEQHCSH
jgi:ribulose-phosphate 3-epimerase